MWIPPNANDIDVGSESGRVGIVAVVDGQGAEVSLPDPIGPIIGVSWSRSDHLVAITGSSARAPILLMAHDPHARGALTEKH